MVRLSPWLSQGPAASPAAVCTRDCIYKAFTANPPTSAKVSNNTITSSTRPNQKQYRFYLKLQEKCVFLAAEEQNIAAQYPEIALHST